MVERGVGAGLFEAVFLDLVLEGGALETEVFSGFGFVPAKFFEGVVDSFAFELIELGA